MKRMTKPVKKFGMNALVWREGTWYVAKAVEVEVASQGKTAKQALANLQEALELYFSGLRLEKLFPSIQYA